MEPHWPSVYVICAFVVVVAAVHLVVKACIDGWLIRRTVVAEMGKAVQAVSKRLDASEIYLTAAEQHTALQQDWEVKRLQEHQRRQKENVQALKLLIQQELDKRLSAATKVVVSEVQQVPEKVVQQMADHGSQDGTTTPTPKADPK